MADMIREAIILAGGKGTRLQNVVKNVPKPLAPVSGEPFLNYLIRYLQRQGIERVILSVGYMYEKIMQTYGHSFNGVEVDYSVEHSPLGTGGAIAKAIGKTREGNALILNGDSFMAFNLADFEKEYERVCRDNPSLKYPVLMLLKELHSVDRYGSVLLEKNRIISFEEKTFREQALINAGVYLFDRRLFLEGMFCGRFSFEKDFLEKRVDEGIIFGMSGEGYFIDIGVEEDYFRAQNELKQEIEK